VNAIFEDRFNVVILMVDDGSTDGTSKEIIKLVDNLELKLLRHKKNRGPGKAFGTAFNYLEGVLDNDDWVVTMEGDNTSHYELLEQMFKRKEEGYDVILASPYMYGGGILNTSVMRVFLSSMANIFVKEFLGLHGILTVSSFYRLYRGSVINKLQDRYGSEIIQLPGYECMVELLLKLVNMGTTISEIPMILDANQRVGKSKMKIIRTILGYLRVWKYRKRWRELAASQKP
jgi:dolichol-phosphate mannosyltransferase